MIDNISFNKLLTEKYSLLKNITKKYNYSDELLNMLAFIYMSFYIDFGPKCDQPLCDLFNNVKIIYGTGTLNEVAQKNNFGTVPQGSVAVTISTTNLNAFTTNNSIKNPKTILLATQVEGKLVSPLLKLEMLLHEIRHILMSYFNTNILLDKDTYYIRSGLQETYFKKGNGITSMFSLETIGRTLDEITNTYITELLINRIISFQKYNIENPTLKLYLNSIKSNEQYKSLGYKHEVELLSPLLTNQTFINTINIHEFDGEISIVKNLFENNTDICNYKDFCNLLDDIYQDNRKHKLENNTNINKLKAIVLDIKNNLESHPQRKR